MEREINSVYSSLPEESQDLEHLTLKSISRHSVLSDTHLVVLWKS